MSDAPHALIAGAGIGGLTAALWLARAGFRVSLIERAQALTEVGAGLQVSPNASAILRDLGVLPKLLDAALAPEAIRIRSARDGRTLHLLPLQNAEARWGAPYLLIHRGDLQKALLDLIVQTPAIALSLDSELTDFAETKRGVEATARQRTGETHYSGDCLIGADGVRSIVRRKLTGKALPTHVIYVAWRALIEARLLPAALRRPESTLWLGPKAHLVHYPLRGGSVVNLVAVVEDHAAIDSHSDLWSLPGEPAEIAAQFAAWPQEARSLIAAAGEWRKWPLADPAQLPRWNFGRIALMGDAAHPMLPFLAQGAAQAIEDAAMLGAMLTPGSPVEPCLAAYAAARRPRANRIQTLSRRQGRIYHLDVPAIFFRDLALQTLGARLLARYDWLYKPRPMLK